MSPKGISRRDTPPVTSGSIGVTKGSGTPKNLSTVSNNVQQSELSGRPPQLANTATPVRQQGTLPARQAPASSMSNPFSAMAQFTSRIASDFRNGTYGEPLLPHRDVNVGKASAKCLTGYSALKALTAIKIQ